LAIFQKNQNSIDYVSVEYKTQTSSRINTVYTPLQCAPFKQVFHAIKCA